MILKEILYNNIIYNTYEAINFLKTVLKTNSTTFYSYSFCDVPMFRMDPVSTNE